MPQILVDARGISTSFRFTETSFFVDPTKPSRHNIASSCSTIFNSFKQVPCTGVPLRNVISAKFTDGNILVGYLVRTGKKRRLTFVTAHGTVKDEDSTRAEEWCQALLLAAYKGLSAPMHPRLF
jgi:sphingosine kinase